jgi:uncharacterized protein YllA (UPF0747 family)
LRFRELAAFPALFADFCEGAPAARQFFPYVPDAGNLRARAESFHDRTLPRRELCEILHAQAERFSSGERARSNLAKLKDPQTVAVVTTLHPELFGGPLCSWLKAFTAARLAAWLGDFGIAAVPVGWMEANVRPGDLSVGLLATGGPLRVGLERTPALNGAAASGIEELLARIAQVLGVGVEQSDLLLLLKAAYASEADLSLAWGRSISKLLDSCGIVLLDPRQPDVFRLAMRLLSFVEERRAAVVLAEQEKRLRAAGYGGAQADGTSGNGPREGAGGQFAGLLTSLVMQHLLLPVAANVIEESEAYSFALEEALFPELQLCRPLAWPRVSATILDARSRKVLQRYGLCLGDLFAGPEALTENLMKRLVAQNTLNRLGNLEEELDKQLKELAGLVPSGDRLKTRIEKCRLRMAYQLEKLKTRFSDAQRQRREAIRRQVTRLCDSLAPWGRLQERELAGFQFIQRYSNALGKTLYEGIDPWKFEHQLIPID